jgi:predicted transcriptional regulator
MKTIEFGRVIEVDEETDGLLQRIAEAEGDVPDVRILRKAIPDREQFVDYLKRRNLADTPGARDILAQLGPERVKVPARLSFAAKAKTLRKPRIGRNPVTGEKVVLKAKMARKKTRKRKKQDYSKTLPA